MLRPDPGEEGARSLVIPAEAGIHPLFSLEPVCAGMTAEEMILAERTILYFAVKCMLMDNRGVSDSNLTASRQNLY